MNFSRQPKGSAIIRTGTILALITLSISSQTLSAHGLPYGLKYDLGYSGVFFAGGVISLASNLTNTGQPTVRITSISLASDFWSNGTRQVTSGFPFNLTTGANKIINTVVPIPTNAAIGNHNIIATANWQNSNSSGWYTASPVVTTITITVSQTLDSLLSSLATILLIGLGVAAAIVVLVVLLVIRRRRKSKSSAPSSVSLGPNQTTTQPR